MEWFQCVVSVVTEELEAQQSVGEHELSPQFPEKLQGDTDIL